jgi:hypothetical protein
MNMPPRKTKPITHHIPEHLYEAFLQNATEFLQNAHVGSTTAQRALEVRSQDRDAGLDSLAFLLRLTLGSSGQCGIVARFLAGLYNGIDFPFDLTELRAIDADLFEHCMAVLRLDNTPTVEIHKYIPDGDKVFLKMLQDWNLVKRPAPPPTAGEWYNVTYASYGSAPGYRSYSLFVQMDGKDGKPPGERIELNFTAEDSVRIVQDIIDIHKQAWDRNDRRAPIDIKPGEQRPHWLPK